MSATVAAALKKIAVALLTDKKALKTIGGIVLGVLIIIIMPIVAVVSIFNGSIEIDTDRLQTMVVENLSVEEQAKLQAVEDTMYAIEDAMLAAGFPARVKEAQVLYVLALSDFADDNGFVEKLVGCFTAEQTDAQLISTVNAAFGTSLAPEDFTQVMQAIRAVYINTSHYTDPSTKNNLDLVQWAIAAEKAGWGYVWGTFGEVLTESYYEAMTSRCPGAKLYGTGVIENFELQFKGQSHGAFATIAPKDGASVPVAVWEISKRNEQALDRYEGYPSHYFKQDVPVQLDGKEVTAMVYVMNLKMDFGLPAPYYYDIVREGYEDCGLDPAALEQTLRESTVQFYGSHWPRQESIFRFESDADPDEDGLEEDADPDLDEDEPELDETDPFYFSEGMHL